jgi:AraC family transcriptional regulator of adaptative response/methylated-DNA-[protein]-cysteine methyltransferase
MTRSRRSAAPAPHSVDPRYTAVVARDRSADGTFWYAVRTTGVYCKPSCGARTPRPENVSFHTSPDAARAAGFRPCKRCRPDEIGDGLHTEVVTTACRQIERAVDAGSATPTLQQLADRAGYSPHHFHRLFVRATGVTPRRYAAARRAAQLARALPSGSSVSAAMHDAGYSSTSRLHDASTSHLGMTPRAVREGGRGEAVRYAIANTSLGWLLVGATTRGVCAIEFGEDADALVEGLRDRFPAAELIGRDPDFGRIIARVVALVERPSVPLDLPLDIQGTAFQQRVWTALQTIAVGRTASYAEIATAIGQPAAVRAVAQACGANTLAVAIPCHRVVRTDGALGGYKWGEARKRTLLSREERAS